MSSDRRSRIGRLGWNLLFSLGVGADPKEENARRTYVIGAALLLSLTAPALAGEFYIVQNPTTKKCTIVTEKPTTTTTTTTTVVGGTTYTTRTEAENVLKKTTVCTTSDDDEDE